MNQWSVSHGKDGFSLYLNEVPLWAYITETAFEVVDTKLGHPFCGGGHAWMWKIHVGKPRRNQDGDLENSVGDYLFKLGNKAMALTDTHGTTVARIPLPDDIGGQLWGPDFRYWEEEEVSDLT